MDVKKHMKITNFLLTISEWDRHIEVSRQFLNSMESFEPYAAYLRLSAGTGEPITPKNISKFLKENDFQSINASSLESVVRMFDTRMSDSIDFEDFLKMILSRDNPDLRFNAVSNPNYEVDYGQKLSDQIEYCMARFFSQGASFLQRISRDPEIQTVINDPELFGILDKDKTGFLGFDNLKKFFELSKLRLRDEEIVSILRTIDINRDGNIDSDEFDYFVSLCQGLQPDKNTLSALKQKSVEERLTSRGKSKEKGIGAQGSQAKAGESADEEVETNAASLKTSYRLRYISRRNQPNGAEDIGSEPLIRQISR
jgi:Ca2+-binding EF-hand superfamily protein